MRFRGDGFGHALALGNFSHYCVVVVGDFYHAVLGLFDIGELPEGLRLAEFEDAAMAKMGVRDEEDLAHFTSLPAAWRNGRTIVSFGEPLAVVIPTRSAGYC